MGEIIKDLKSLGTSQLTQLDLTEARKCFDSASAAAHSYLFNGQCQEDSDKATRDGLSLASALLYAMYEHLSSDEKERVSHMVGSAISSIDHALLRLENKEQGA